MKVFYTYDDKQNEKKKFIETLYHDRRGGQMILLRKVGSTIEQKSSCDMSVFLSTGTDEASYYTTVNTFRGWKRTSDRVFNFTSIFLDLDCHTDDLEKIRIAKARTAEILEEKFESGELAIPTMITDTGRGFGLQYVLKSSISNTWRTERIRGFYKKVQKSLFAKYQEILSVDSTAAQLDSAVIDSSRVCRIPGTYNSVAGTNCRLISVSEKFYELSELVQGCHLWDWKSDEEYKKIRNDREKKRKERLASGKVVSFNEYRLPFLSARLEQMEMLQRMRGNDCTGVREQLLFIVYSTLVQLDWESAPKKLSEFNDRFNEPLDQAELDHIIDETSKNTGLDGHEGYYKLTNEYVIERLGMSKEEIRACGLDMGWRRTAERRIAREKKSETRKMVIELLRQADRLTYDEISGSTGVSKRTVCKIAKDENLTRNKKNKGSTKIIDIKKVQAIVTENEKSEKIATRSVCVPFSAFDKISFSTPAARWAGGEGLPCFDWLQSRASSDPVAQELWHLVTWSAWDSIQFGATIETYVDQQMPMVMKHPDRLAELLDTVARKFFRYYKDELGYLFGIHNIADVLPTVWTLFIGYGRKMVKARHAVVDVTTETPEQRETRIERYLKKYKDERFDIIEGSDEYQRRLDSDVLRMVKVTCMQVNRLKRDYFLIEKKQVLTRDIKQCFDSLTYKDIVVICERMAHQGTIQKTEKTFFYILQVVWKYKHPDTQAERLTQKTNSFFDFDTHKQNIDLDELAHEKLLRRFQNQNYR